MVNKEPDVVFNLGNYVFDSVLQTLAWENNTEKLSHRKIQLVNANFYYIISKKEDYDDSLLNVGNNFLRSNKKSYSHFQ
ncbi:hypothetical protein FACS1894174_05070 [Bacteroidia bacterium]|nr:hypothetical protein FACS1894174_05070 [Bacteroidia bacterium]